MAQVIFSEVPRVLAMRCRRPRRGTTFPGREQERGRASRLRRVCCALPCQAGGWHHRCDTIRRFTPHFQWRYGGRRLRL